MGRILGLVTIIAAVSVGMAGIAARSSNQVDAAASADPRGDSGENWTTQKRQRGGWSAMASTGPADGSRSSGGEVRLERSGDSHFYADTEVDGRSVRMMVDSGASIVALTRRDAQAIGIDVDRLPVSGTARTAGGDVPMRRVILDRVEIDGLAVRGVEAAVVDADMGVSLLGQSFLAKLDAVNVEGDRMTLR